MALVSFQPGVKTTDVGRAITELVSLYDGPGAGEFYITSGLRDGPNDDRGSHHFSGDAVDIGFYDDPEPDSVDQREARELARWLTGPEVGFQFFKEFIHSTPFTDDNGFYGKNGRNVGPSGFDQGTKSQHVNHIHVAGDLDQINAAINKVKAGSMDTLYGWDASDFDHDRGARISNVAKAAAEGISFFTHKITESNNIIHYHAGEMVNAAVRAGIPFYGFYVVPRTPGPSIESQVDFAIRQANKQLPQWKSLPGFFWQVDTEKWEYDNVSPYYGESMCKLLEHKTGKKVVHYAPQWAYGNSIPNTSRPLWASNYISNPIRKFKEAYQVHGGNHHPGWRPYSGRVPKVLQYGSRTIIGGQHTCDANAFRGTKADFAKMIGAPITVPTPPLVKPPIASLPITPPKPPIQEDDMPFLHGPVPTGPSGSVVVATVSHLPSTISLGVDFGQAKIRVAEHQAGTANWVVTEVLLSANDGARYDLPTKPGIDRRSLVRVPLSETDECKAPVGYIAWW